MCETIITGTLDFNHKLTRSQIVSFENLMDDQYYRGCPWILTNDNTGLKISHFTQLHHCVKWLKSIIEKFVIPATLTLNGTLSINIKWNNIILNNSAFINVHDKEITSSDFKHFDPNLILINWLYHENKRLTTENQQYQLELDYRPDGKGALLAQEHFESLASTQK